MSRVDPERLDILLSGDSLLTTAEVAAALRVLPGTVTGWIRAGELRAVKVGRGWRVRRSDFDSLVKGGASDGPHEDSQ